jgi:hypothetical protein
METPHTLRADQAATTATQPHPHRVEKLGQRKRRGGKLRSRLRHHRGFSYAQNGRSAMPTIHEEEEADEPLGSEKHKPEAPFPPAQQQYAAIDSDYYIKSKYHQEAFEDDSVKRRTPFSANQHHRIRRNSSRAKPNVWQKGMQKTTPELSELRKRHDQLNAYIKKTKWDIEKRSVWTKKEAEHKELEESVMRDLEVIREGMDDMELAEYRGPWDSEEQHEVL